MSILLALQDAGGFVDGVGSAAGSCTVTATGQSTWQAVATSAATSTVPAVGQSTWQAVATAAGSGVATGVGAAAAQTVGTAAGNSTIEAVGAGDSAATAASAGNSTVIGVGQSTADGEGFVECESDAHGVSEGGEGGGGGGGESMAIAFDASSNSGTSPSTSDLSWTHTPVGTPRGVIVHIVQTAGGGADSVGAGGVTYGGVAMTRAPVGFAQDTSSEPGAAYSYHLGASIPTGAQTVFVDNIGVNFIAACITVTAGADTEVSLSAKQEGDAASPVTVTLATTQAGDFVTGAMFSGFGAAGNIAVGADYTDVHEFDFGNQVGDVCRRTALSPGGSINVSWTTAGTEDSAAVGLAIKEIVAAPTDTVGSASGTGTAEAAGQAGLHTVGTAAGVGEALGIGATTWDGVGSSAGTGEALGVGARTVEEQTTVGGGGALWQRPANRKKQKYRCKDGRIICVETVRDAEQLLYEMLNGEEPEAILDDVPAPVLAPSLPKRRKGKPISKAAVKRAARRTPERSPFDWMAEPARAVVLDRLPALGPVGLTEAVEAAAAVRAEMRRRAKADEDARLKAEAKRKRNRRIAMAMMQMMAEL